MATESKDKLAFVKIRFPKSINTFSELSELTKALANTEPSYTGIFPDATRRYRRSLEYHEDKINTPSDLLPEVKLVSFHVGSPAEVSVWANTAWIAIMLASISNYHNLKNNIPLLLRDLTARLKNIKGISDKARMKLTGYVVEVVANASGADLEQMDKMSETMESHMRVKLQNAQGNDESEYEYTIIEIVDPNLDFMAWM